MLRNADTIRGCTVGASDGEVGKVDDLYFDDQTWTVRYLVARTGILSGDKRVLIAPRRIDGVDADRKVLEANLTKAEVKASLPVESDRPVEECMEIVVSSYFWPPQYEAEGCGEGADVHLRSVEEVEGYTLAGTDGEIGHVAGFLVDDSDWVIRYLLVDTRSLWPGKHVLLSPEWIDKVDWSGRRVRANLAKAVIKESPELDRDSPVSRKYESDLCHFYEREGYWTREPCPEDD